MTRPPSQVGKASRNPRHRIIGLDLSKTAMGWCLLDGGTVSDKGEIDWRRNAYECKSEWLVRFRNWLGSTLHNLDPDLWVFEDVRFTQGDAGVQLTHMRGVLLEFLAFEKLDYTSHKIAAIKKHATGKGNAGKDEMVKAAIAKWGDTGWTDNMADAAWVARLAWDEAHPLREAAGA